MEPCEAIFRLEAAETRLLRHAMEGESMASSVQSVEGAIHKTWVE